MWNAGREQSKGGRVGHRSQGGTGAQSTDRLPLRAAVRRRSGREPRHIPAHTNRRPGQRFAWPIRVFAPTQLRHLCSWWSPPQTLPCERPIGCARCGVHVHSCSRYMAPRPSVWQGLMHACGAFQYLHTESADYSPHALPHHQMSTGASAFPLTPWCSVGLAIP